MKQKFKYINNAFFIFTTIAAACTFLYSICSQYEIFGAILSVLYGLSCFYFFEFIKNERNKEIQNVVKNIKDLSKVAEDMNNKNKEN